MTPRPYVGIYSGEKGHQFLQENWILALEKWFQTFVMVSISDMPSINYSQNLGEFWILQKIRSINNAGLVIHVLHHWQLLEEIYTQDIQKKPNNVHNDSNGLLSVITILVTDVHAGETVF